MTDAEQVKEFIDDSLNGLEESVSKKDIAAIRHGRQEFNALITEYQNIIGMKNVKNYLGNYNRIMQKGGYSQ